MHKSAFDYVARIVHQIGWMAHGKICELGSRDVNGSVRPLFAASEKYIGVDWMAGPGVDVVADACSWLPDEKGSYDVVVSTEVLEHVQHPCQIIQTAVECLKIGGVLIVTAAGIGRYPHSAIDGGELRPGEWYKNISESELRSWLVGYGGVMIDTFSNPTDIYLYAVKVPWKGSF